LLVIKGANFTTALYCHHFGSRDVIGKIGSGCFPIGDALTQPCIFTISEILGLKYGESNGLVIDDVT